MPELLQEQGRVTHVLTGSQVKVALTRILTSYCQLKCTKPSCLNCEIKDMKSWFARLTDGQVADLITNDKVPVLYEEGPAPLPALEEVASAVEGESVVFLSKDIGFISLAAIKGEGRHDEGDSIRGSFAPEGQGG